MTVQTHPQLIEFKAQARLLRNENPAIGFAQAHEVLARSLGFKTYAAFRQSLKDSSE